MSWSSVELSEKLCTTEKTVLPYRNYHKYEQTYTSIQYHFTEI